MLFPSPLVGEGGSERSEEPGEGEVSIVSSIRSSTPFVLVRMSLFQNRSTRNPRGKIGVAYPVMFAVKVLGPIGFHDNLVLVTHEIRYPWTKRHLSAKLKVRKLS